MEHFDKTDKNKVKRIPDRGHYDKKTIYEILDHGYICHVGFVVDSQPYVIPTAYGRKDNVIFIHGATTSRMLKVLQQGAPVCLTVTHNDGLVLARSVFHHSMNYRSAVIFGTASLVPDNRKMEALQVITENILQGRWEEARKPNSKELKATSVLEIEIEQASSKIRTGPPGDEKEDYQLPIWAGVLPVRTAFDPPETDPLLSQPVDIPDSVRQLFS
jgi:hypothetical protein